MTDRPQILVTNDDGINAPGIIALRAALLIVGDVTVVAPERPRSASGHAITLHKPLRADLHLLPGGGQGYATNGTPSDCVVLGVLALVKRCDLVISGINHGANLGEDLTYSGTVSAAMEGAICGIPSFAISLMDTETPDFGPAAAFAARLARKLLTIKLPPDTLLNVNVPAVPGPEIKGVAITRQGRRRYEGRVERRLDPRGRPYYWLGGESIEDVNGSGSDGEALQNNYISITPLHLNLTAGGLAKEMRDWELG